MPEIQQKSVRSEDGQNIYYETCYADEAAPVVMLVHGIGGDVGAWTYVRNILINDGFSTVALDLRGHGYSDHPAGAKYYTMDVLSRDILHVIDAEELDTVILVGHSGGAVLALDFVLRYPGRIQALILLAGSHLPPAYMRSRTAKRIAHALIALGAFASPPALAPWHSTYPSGKFHQEYESWGLARTILHNSLRSYLWMGRELINIELEGRLGEIRMPTLLVVGEKDSIYPLIISQAMHENIPNSTLRIIPGANHVIVLNNIDETAGHIIDFVRGL
ncbi:MAG: alpha/beta hydrolase [bacterium]|nr:alpha/beta hydrolase [bacterium]